MDTPDSSTLTHEQREKTSMTEITNGATIAAAAAKAGVARSTIYRWLECDELLRGAVYQTLEEQSDAADDRITEAARKAIRIVSDLMDQPDISHSLRLRRRRRSRAPASRQLPPPQAGSPAPPPGTAQTRSR